MIYFIMAYKLGLKPKEVDELPATLVDEFLVILKKLSEIGEGDIDKMFERGI